MTADEFHALCKAHDLTFEYSDDGRVYNRGNEQLKAIEAAAKELPSGVAAKIWNQVVGEKVLPGHEVQYLWKEEA